MLESIYRKIEHVLSPSTARIASELAQAIPSPPTLNTRVNAGGAETWLECGVSYFNEPVVLKSVDDIGRMCVNDATKVFLSNFITRKIRSRVVSIKDINAISCSKLDFEKLETVYDMGEYNYKWYREKKSELNEDDYYQFCLKEGFQEQNTFVERLWNEELRWLNSDGSHRMSTAIYLALKEGRDYNIQAEITQFDINVQFLREVRSGFECYFMHANSSVVIALHSAFNIRGVGHTYINLRRHGDESSDDLVMLMVNKYEPICRQAKEWLNACLDNGLIVRLDNMLSPFTRMDES